MRINCSGHTIKFDDIREGKSFKAVIDDKEIKSDDKKFSSQVSTSLGIKTKAEYYVPSIEDKYGLKHVKLDDQGRLTSFKVPDLDGEYKVQYGADNKVSKLIYKNGEKETTYDFTKRLWTGEGGKTSYTDENATAIVAMLEQEKTGDISKLVEKKDDINNARDTLVQAEEKHRNDNTTVYVPFVDKDRTIKYVGVSVSKLEEMAKKNDDGSIKAPDPQKHYIGEVELKALDKTYQIDGKELTDFIANQQSSYTQQDVLNKTAGAQNRDDLIVDRTEVINDACNRYWTQTIGDFKQQCRTSYQTCYTRGPLGGLWQTWRPVQQTVMAPQVTKTPTVIQPQTRTGNAK